MRRLILLAVLVSATAIAGSGCTTFSTGLGDPAGTGSYTELGVGSGSATGVYLFGFFPLTEGGDAQAAYKSAVNSVKGADGLVGATMQSTIMNLFIIQLEIVKVRGQAVKK